MPLPITFRGLPLAVFTVALAKVSFTIRPRVAVALAEALVLTKNSQPDIALKIQKYMAGCTPLPRLVPPLKLQRHADGGGTAAGRWHALLFCYSLSKYFFCIFIINAIFTHTNTTNVLGLGVVGFRNTKVQ